MSLDAELLGQLVNDGLPPKTIAFHTGVSTQTISRYQSGYMTIPMRFWHDLFAVTHDPRILALVTGAVPMSWTILADVPNLDADRDGLKAAIESLRLYHDQQKYLADILGDGRIDEADRLSMKAFNRAHLACQLHTAAIHKAVNHAFNSIASRT